MSKEQVCDALLRFGNFTLDPRCGLLRYRDTEVRLRPQSFEVLRVLAENHGRLVTKRELHDQVWHGTSVTDDSLTQCVLDIRKAVGDADRDLVRTVPRRGYLLNAPVERVGPDRDQAGDVPSTPGKPLITLMAATVALGLIFWAPVVAYLDERANRTAANSRPNSIAILRLQNRSTVASDLFFVEGLHDNILTSLTRTKLAGAISRTPVLSSSVRDQSAAEIGAQLHVRAILEGGVQRVGGRIQVSVQLVDTQTDLYLWAETYYGDISNVDPLALQGDISRSIAIAVESALLQRPNSQAAANVAALGLAREEG